MTRFSLHRWLCLLVAATLVGCSGGGGLGTKSTVTEIAQEPVTGEVAKSATIGALQVEFYGDPGPADGLVAALTTRLDGGGLAKKGGVLAIQNFTTQQRRQGPPERGSKFGSLHAVLSRDGKVVSAIQVEAKTDSTEITNEAETWALIEAALMAEFATAIIDNL